MAATVFNAYQKFYSALSNLKRFCNDNDFYENVSALDSFFSEFRSITFVLQKSIGDDLNKRKIYEGKIDQYLEEFKWFNYERVNSVHKSPFSLVKRIRIRVFSPEGGYVLCDREYTIENDESTEKILCDISDSFVKSDSPEVFFSASFSYFEKNKPDRIYDKLLNGINAMNSCLDSIAEAYAESCSMCDNIREKIQRMMVEISFIDARLNSDYIFYPYRNEFERASIMQMLPSRKMEANIDTTFCNMKLNAGRDRFEKFVLLHVIIGETDLMPTIWTINKQAIFNIDVFNSDIKTTFYRKIADIAERVMKEDIEEVFFMFTYSVLYYEDFKNEITSKQRIEKGNTEFLAFYRIKNDVAEEYIFEKNNLSDIKKVIEHLRHGRKALDIGKTNMKPILDAFTAKMHISD